MWPSVIYHCGKILNVSNYVFVDRKELGNVKITDYASNQGDYSPNKTFVSLFISSDVWTVLHVGWNTCSLALVKISILECVYSLRLRRKSRENKKLWYHMLGTLWHLFLFCFFLCVLWLVSISYPIIKTFHVLWYWTKLNGGGGGRPWITIYTCYTMCVGSISRASAS